MSSIDILIFTCHFVSLHVKIKFTKSVRFYFFMGNATLTSISAQDFILILQNEKCIASHAVWAQLSLDDLDEFTIEQTSLDDLIAIRDNVPTNFVCLAAATSIGFSHITILLVEQPTRILAVQRFLWFIRLLLTVPDTSLTRNLWFQTAFIFNQSFVPAEVLISSCYNILFIENPTDDEDIKLVKIDVVETMLYFINQSFITRYNADDLPNFINAFDNFNAQESIRSLITYSFSPRVLNSFLVLVSQCIFTLKKWKTVVEKTQLEYLENFILQNILDDNIAIIPFAFSVILNHNKLKEKWMGPKIAREMSTKFMLFAHNLSKEGKSNSSFILLFYMVYMLMEHLDVNTPCNFLHASTLSDLAFECIMDPIVFNFNVSKPIIPMCMDCLSMICRKVSKISDFVALRLITLFRLFKESDMVVDSDLVYYYKQLLIIINMMMQKNPKMAMFCHHEADLSAELSSLDKDAQINVRPFTEIDEKIKAKFNIIFVVISRDTFPIDFSQFKISDDVLFD